MKQSTIFDGLDFEIDKTTNKIVMDKISKPLKVGSSSNLTRISEIYATLDGVFEKLKTLLPYTQFELITTQERLQSYLDKALENGILALDTESAGLDPLMDELAGLCIYTPNENPAYVPTGHFYYEHNVDASDFMNKVADANEDGTLTIIMHNAKYDVRVIEANYKRWLYCDFDTMIASQLLNENEEHGLKQLWSKYIMNNSDKDVKTYRELFGNHSFNNLDPSKVFIYGAMDGLMTYELFMFQKDYLNKNHRKCQKADMVDTSDLFYEIEMPIVDITARMEQRGIHLDTIYAEELRVKYTEDKKQIEKKIQDILMNDWEEIQKNLTTDELMKLDNPINIASPIQLKIVLSKGYGISAADDSVDKKTLDRINDTSPEHTELVSLILEYRSIEKLLGTYITALVEKLNPKTGMLHAQFKTIGTETGRFSCSKPNLQNIPSKNEDIRPMFVPAPGNVFVGADYSSQEPRLLAELSQDPVLLDAFRRFLDVYSVLSSLAYELPYEMCTKETPDGKVRRNHGKTLQLALSYGMQARSLASSLDIDIEQGRELLKKFKSNLRVAFEFGEEQKAFCKANGYVKTAWGRKRRFPEYMKEEYEIIDPENRLDGMTADRILRKVRSVWKFSERKELIESLSYKHGVTIIDNTLELSEYDTNILNSIIQGSGGDMLKVAMVKVHRDSIMKKLGAFLVLTVHDELIVECPKENAEVVKERLEHLMVEASEEVIKSIPSVANGTIMERWVKD